MDNNLNKEARKLINIETEEQYNYLKNVVDRCRWAEKHLPKPLAFVVKAFLITKAEVKFNLKGGTTDERI